MINEKKFMEFIAALEEAGAEHVSFDDLRKFVNEFSKISDWIPCSERLPESFTEVVLVCLKNGAVSVAICGTDGEFTNMMVGASRQKFRYFPEHNPVIAWQPLPEAYHG